MDRPSVEVASDAEAGGAPVIRVSGVSLSYGAVDAVAEVSFDVRQGEFVSLIGPSGCGKSSALRLIGGLLAPDAGTVSVAG